MPSNPWRKTERYFDLTGSATYLTVTAVALVLSDDLDARAVIVAAMVAVWALRLGTFCSVGCDETAVTGGSTRSRSIRCGSS